MSTRQPRRESLMLRAEFSTRITCNNKKCSRIQEDQYRLTTVKRMRNSLITPYSKKGFNSIFGSKNALYSNYLSNKTN